MRHKTPKCDSTKLDKDSIETYMRTILEGIRHERKINQQMEEQQIVQVLRFFISTVFMNDVNIFGRNGLGMGMRGKDHLANS